MTNWTNVHPNFTEEMAQEWINKGFSKEECKEWIDIGLKPTDANYAQWLKDEFSVDVNYVSNYGEEKILKEEYSKLSIETIEQIKNWSRNELGYLQLTPERQLLLEKLIPNPELRYNYRYCGLCTECSQPNTGKQWCQGCNIQHWQHNFSKWTSGNLTLDTFLQKHQLQATDWRQVLEWIPYEKFTNVEYLAEGGFGKVYKAEWIDGGPIERWDNEHRKWHRRRGKKEGNEGDYKDVALKSLNNFQSLDTNFLQEVVKHSTIGGWIVPCYGISQDPITNNYIMVIEYKKDGSLRQHIQSNNLNFATKLLQLYSIADGLKDIHNKGFMHRDFHAGNVLSQKIGKDSFGFIADLGLCKPINEKKDNKIYGVLPYVAPEVLRGDSYTQAADIYSFGIIMYEVFANLPPYHNLSHDKNLALKITQGFRPDLDRIKIPQLLKDLISQCWSADQLERPSANELKKILFDWWIGVTYKRDGIS